MHTLIVSNPGHFHAALALRNRHDLLHDDVYVYAQDGTDLERFLALVNAFNTREHAPTQWRLHVYRGTDHLDRLIAERRGNVALLAGRNEGKMNAIKRMQSSGFAVLGDKTWLIDEHELSLVHDVVNSKPLALDMMTERWDVGNRLLRALCEDDEVFGGFRSSDSEEPAITLVSVHHLYKSVNGAPLRRPAWYFDIGVQGEGITDVTTHLADLALWMTDRGSVCDFPRDVNLVYARQWPTLVPRDVFRLITGLDEFPIELRPHVRGEALRYMCNAEVGFSLRKVHVRMEALWGLEEPAGGGDEFTTILEGAHCRLFLVHDRSTAFESVVKILARDDVQRVRGAVERALARHAEDLPGVGVTQEGQALTLRIPAALKTTHEQHFAKVLDAFLRQVDCGGEDSRASGDLLAKYSLLANARQHSSREN